MSASSQRAFQALSRREAHAHVAPEDREVEHLLRLEGARNQARLGLRREAGLRRQLVDEVRCLEAVQRRRGLRVEVGDLPSKDLLLVIAARQAGLADCHGDHDGHHQRRDQGEVVGGRGDEDDDGDRHALEAAEHRGAPHHGVDPGGGGAGQVVAHRDGADPAADQPADEHRAREVPGGHRHARQAYVQRRVGDEREELVCWMNRSGVPAGEQQVDRALRRGEQQRRHRIVLALPAVVAHQLGGGLAQGLAPPHLRHQRAHQCAQRRVKNSFRHLRVRLGPP
mmetsp:Transcript_2329/g.6554  ORF Transcript_2329/g.6554 Transcript_2329/m.6554 type:complete len:282 (+) Transcript_2329:404-1249(+)